MDILSRDFNRALLQTQGVSNWPRLLDVGLNDGHSMSRGKQQMRHIQSIDSAEPYAGPSSRDGERDFVLPRETKSKSGASLWLLEIRELRNA